MRTKSFFTALLIAGGFFLWGAAVPAATVYVSPSGTHVAPFTNWVEAATNLQAALDVTHDGDLVLLQATTHNIRDTVRVTNAVTIRGDGSHAVLYGPYNSSIYTQGMLVSHAGAVLDQLSFSYFGGQGIEGGSVCLAAPALLTNCQVQSSYGSRGGGVYVAPSGAGSTLVKCNFNYNMAYDSGGGLYAAATCTVYGCDFGYNYAYTGGAAVCSADAILLRNSYIHDNSLNRQPSRGAGIFSSGNAIIESCTIARNSGASSGGGLATGVGTAGLWNTILWANTATSNANYEQSGATFAHCCSSPLPEGTNNIADDPLLPPSGGLPDLESPVINAGTNQPWMTGASSFDPYTPRIVEDIVDIGAYEVAFGCDFSADVTEGFAPLEVVFTARVFGGNSTNIYYWWDFNRDGSYDAEGYGLHTVTNIYSSIGTYNVELNIQGPAPDYNSGYFNRWSYIKVGSQYIYVSPSGTHQLPYTNWGTAATNISAAVQVAVSGSTVFITNATYILSSYIDLNKSVKLQGVGGTPPVLDANYIGRCIYANSPGVEIENLALVNGRMNGWPGGGGILFYYGGTMRNCIVASNEAMQGGGGIYGYGTSAVHIAGCRIEANAGGAGNYGGGIYAYGPLFVSNSVIAANWCGNYGGGIYAGSVADIHNCLISGNAVSNWHGGGVYGSSYPVTITDCTIVSNRAKGSGGGIVFQDASSAAERCRILHNSASSGGGVYSSAGLLRNCVVAQNQAGGYGGGIYSYNTRFENCTIAFNRSDNYGGGAYLSSLAGFTNCVFYENRAVMDNDASLQNFSSAFFDHCSSTETLLPGTNNLTGDPLFANPVTNDYRIRYGSVALNTGTNQAWMASATDLYGNPRITGTCVDMGAHEFIGTSLGVGFTASPGAGYAPLAVVFTARVYRATMDPVTVQWDFDNNGATDAQGLWLTVITNVYASPGSFSVRVAVTNTVGQTDEGVQPDCVTVWGAPVTNYVSSSGTHVAPFTNWITAATNIQAALDAAVDGGVVMLSAETHSITTMPVITKPITLTGPDGNPASAVINGSGVCRGLLLGNPYAQVMHLTVSNGLGDRYGGGIYAPQGGTISNCILRNNYARYSGTPYGGGGLYLAKGLAVNCRMEYNRAQSYGGGALAVEDGMIRNCVIVTNSAGFGGGLALWGGHAEGCMIASNAAPYGAGVHVHSGSLRTSTLLRNKGASFGGGLYFDGDVTVDRCTMDENEAGYGGGAYFSVYTGARLRSCLVVSNSAVTDGGGVYIRGGILENCTVAGNLCTNAAGGAGFDKWETYDRRIVNTIIYHNTGAGTSNNHSFASFTDVDMDHVCTTRIPTGIPAENVITNDPLFAGDFRIGSDSPCFNSGLNESWMTGVLDLDGSARIIYGQVDIGAYESSAPTVVADFAGTPQDGRIPLGVTFSGSFIGVGETGTMFYAWDFDNNGTFDQQGLGLHTVSHTYSNTLYHSVSLFLSNTVAGLTDTETKINYIRARPLPVEHYVSLSGTHQAPFTNWLTAATNPLAGVAAATDFDRVIVGTGTFHLAQALVITNEIELVGAGDAEASILDGGGASRCIELAAAGTLIRDVTVQNGYTGISADGAGILMTASGTVESCVIFNNRGRHGCGIMATNGGRIADCLIVSNRSVATGGFGGGLHAANGTLAERCWIRGNYAGYGGGAACTAGGAIRNSAIAGNDAAFGGGAYTEGGGLLQSCTVAGNTASCYGGIFSGTIWTPAGYEYGLLVNCIVHDNTHQQTGNSADIGGIMDDSMFDHVCVGSMSMEGLTGAGLVAGNPNLADPPNLNLALMPGSVAIDAGKHEDWMDGTTDVDGNPRIRSGIVDLGALEFDPGPFDCWFSRSETAGWTPLSVQLQAYVSGSNQAGLVYCWDTDGDGTNDFTGSGLSSLLVVYDMPGDYSPKLTVTNAAGESASWQYPAPIHVAPGVICVATNGSSVYPFSSWSTAATNIHDAVDLAEDGMLVLVDDGTYALTNQLVVNKAIELSSLNGRDRTILQAAISNRVLYLNAHGAVVDGFDICGGNMNGNGGGVLIDRSAILRDCHVRNSTARLGGGIYQEGATSRVERCMIVSNTASSYFPGADPMNDGRGGGVHIMEGVLDRCVIRGNSAVNGGYTGNGGGVLMAGAEPVVQNCLVTENLCQNLGGGMYLQNGRILNCTIALNIAGYMGQELWWHQHTYGAVENCIMRHTLSGNTTDPSSVEIGYPPVFFTNCLADLDLPGSGNIHADPLFATNSAAWWSLQPGSPCIDAGISNNLTSDLVGLPRPIDGDESGGAVVDIGASEYAPSSLDTDGDGLSDHVEVYENGSDPQDPDSDDDDSNDWEEWVAGTGAGDPDDVFHVAEQEPAPSAPGAMIISWYSVLGRYYTVERALDLMSAWEPLAGCIDLPGTGDLMSATNSMGEADAFYRVNISLTP
ncbi:MAG: right-handed parallel beta-helix repeat-containing protein [Kiritimatiellia bacterium]